MTKRGKKLWSVLLAMVMILTTMFANIGVLTVNAAEKITVDAEQVQAGQTIVHFKPTTFKEPNIYAYKDKTNYAGEWPGTKMTSEGDGWFSFTIEADSANIIFNDGTNQEPPSQQPGYEVSGEIWYVQGTGAEGILKKKPEDNPTKTPATPTPTNASTTLPPTDEPSEIIKIKEITPGESKIKVNEEVTLKTEVTLDKSIDYAYYKYEVKFENEYVGDHYYSKKSEYTFKPEKEGTYTVTVYAQAHNMESTTVKTTVTYDVVDDSDVDVTPSPTVVPTSTVETPSTETPSTETPSTETPSTGTPSTGTPSTGIPSTGTPGETTKPEKTTKPEETTRPGETTKPEETKKPQVTPTLKPTATTKPTEQPEETVAPNNEIKAVKLALNKKTPQYRGRAIKISATVVGGSNLKYKFTLYNTKTKNIKTLQNYSKKTSVTWRPGKNDIGTYQFWVYVKDSNGDIKTDKSSKFTIKNKKLSIDSVSISKKSKYYTIAANTAGGYGTLKYKYVVKNKKGKVVFKTPYSKSRTAYWKAKKAKKGTYKIYTYVKDSKVKKSKTIKKTIK